MRTSFTYRRNISGSAKNIVGLYRSVKSMLTFTLCLLSLLANAQITPDASGIVYVTETGTGNGSGWNDATGDLQGAINATGVSKVFVASGLYSIQQSGAVNMKNGVEIYGGFNPVNGETDWSTRFLPNQRKGNIEVGNVRTMPGSVLSAAPLDWGNASPTVIANSNLDNSAVLDGFTIVGGGDYVANGGGIRNIGSSPTLRNLLITGNSGTRGGGIYNSNSSPLVTDVVINNNHVIHSGTSTGGEGGAVYNSGNSSPVFTNVLIVANGTGTDFKGGGVHHAGTGTATFINCTFHNNYAGQNNPPSQMLQNAARITSGTVSFINSIVFGGVAGNYTARYSMIEGNVDFSNGNRDASGTSANDVFSSPTNWITSSIGDYGLKYTSPAINSGSNSLFPNLDDGTTDIAGNPRVMNYNNTGLTIDMGAYESSFTPILATGGIVYVKETATGEKDGSSWENATSDLHRAIETEGVSKVFVAVGTYPVGDHSFIMKNGVEIYGGFDPGNDIKALGDPRIFPSLTTEGSVLDGQSIRPVVWNVFTAANPLDNTALLDGFTVKNGSYSDHGGGVRNIYASPVFNHVVIKNNKTTGQRGGGVYNQNGSSVFLNTTVTGNTAYHYGGGMHCENTATVTCINYLSFGNTTTSNQNRELVSQGSGSTFVNATIVGINAKDVWLDKDNGQLINSIVPSGINNTVNPELGVLKNSLVSGAANGVDGNIDATGISLSVIFTDPVNGDYTLKSISPAVNRGDNSVFPNLDASTHDMAGNNRVYDFANGGTIDMGAFESSFAANTYRPLAPDANGIIYVRTVSLGAGTGSSWEDATDSFQAAINTATVQKVFAGSGNYALSERLYMKNGVEIYGGFDPGNNIRTLDDQRILPDNTSITAGSVLHGSNIIIITNNNNSVDNTAVLDGFTLTNGGTGGSGIYNVNVSPIYRNLYITGNNNSGYGAGIRNSNSSPVISNVVIAGNIGQFGAGMYNDNSSPVLTDVVFKNNTAVKDGGGINNNSNSNPLMTNVKFQNNQADYGGGVFNRNSSPTMTGIEITDNIANRDAGGMYNDANSSPFITNLKLTGNTANNASGGGMYNRTNSSPMIINALVAGNTAVANGGAIRNEADSSPELVNVTIAGNNGLNAVYDNSGTTSLANSIVFGTISGNYTAQYVLTDGTLQTDRQSDPGGRTSAAIPADVFTDPANGDYTLKTGSPAINEGSNALFAGLDTHTTDLAGNLRLVGNTIDLGPYENPSGVLPVRWISFESQLNDQQKAVLTWKVAEINVSHYEVQRSRDARVFQLTGTVAAKGTGTAGYQLTDPVPVSGTVYYRIRQVDRDGTYSYSRILSVPGPENAQLTAYPNPASGKVTVDVGAEYIGTSLRLISAAGVPLLELPLTGRTVTLSLNGYSPGVYLLRTFDGKAVKLIRN